MAKRKRSSKPSQPRHKSSSPSQFDKRKRLDVPSPNRKKTVRARVPLVGEFASMIASMACGLDCRIAFRLSIIVAGMMLADDRRVAAAWFAAAGVQDDWDRFYDCLISFGKNTRSMALPVLIAIVRKFDPGPDGHVSLACDDTHTRRYGKHVEGAGVHHKPTPGPADGEWMYGHNWVSLCFLANHSLWGVIALPLRSLLYVRAIDVPAIAAKYGWEFRTKHQLAVELVSWFVTTARSIGLTCKIWLVADGAYAAHTLIEPLMKLGVVVFSRLRKDAVLFELPPARKPGQRGRPRIYGKDRISLAKRAAHRSGWQSITYHCRGSCNLWSNVGCWHLNQWMYTFAQLCSWDIAKPDLTDRSNRPWDNPVTMIRMNNGLEDVRLKCS